MNEYDGISNMAELVGYSKAINELLFYIRDYKSDHTLTATELIIVCAVTDKLFDMADTIKIKQEEIRRRKDGLLQKHST